jgi:hypothetical protein
MKPAKRTTTPAREPRAGSVPAEPGARKSAVAKVSHTLSLALAERLEEFAFFQRLSESAVIEHALKSFFEQSEDDGVLGDVLRSNGAGRRRKV